MMHKLAWLQVDGDALNHDCELGLMGTYLKCFRRFRQLPLSNTTFSLLYIAVEFFLNYHSVPWLSCNLWNSLSHPICGPVTNGFIRKVAFYTHYPDSRHWCSPFIIVDSELLRAFTLVGCGREKTILCSHYPSELIVHSSYWDPKTLIYELQFIGQSLTEKVCSQHNSSYGMHYPSQQWCGRTVEF